MTAETTKMNTLVLSDEFVNRIVVGLGEILTKFGAPVLAEINRQLEAARAATDAPVEAKP